MDVFQPLEMKTCRRVRTAPMAGKCPLLVNYYFSLCNIDYTHILSTQDSSYRLNHVFLALSGRVQRDSGSGGRETSTSGRYLSEVMPTFLFTFQSFSIFEHSLSFLRSHLSTPYKCLCHHSAILSGHVKFKNIHCVFQDLDIQPKVMSLLAIALGKETRYGMTWYIVSVTKL